MRFTSATAEPREAAGGVGDATRRTAARLAWIVAIAVEALIRRSGSSPARHEEQ